MAEGDRNLHYPPFGVGGWGWSLKRYASVAKKLGESLPGGDTGSNTGNGTNGQYWLVQPVKPAIPFSVLHFENNGDKILCCRRCCQLSGSKMQLQKVD